MLEAPDLLLKRARSTSVSAVMSSSFAVSHFSFTMSHCEHTAFSLIMKTLEKHDCSEVKEVESSYCHGGRGGGRERNEGWSEFKSRKMMNLAHVFVMDTKS